MQSPRPGVDVHDLAALFRLAWVFVDVGDGKGQGLSVLF